MKNIIIKIVILFFFNYIKNIYKIKTIPTGNDKDIKVITLKNKYTKLLLKNLSIIHEIFLKLDIIYFISQDLLLSYVKDKTINSQIDNIPIFIQKNTFNQKKLIPYLENNQLELNISFGNYNIVSTYLKDSIKNKLSINLHFFEIKNDKILLIKNNLLNNKIILCDKNKIFPLQMVRFSKIDTFIPFDYDYLLSYYYGKNYLNYNVMINNTHTFKKQIVQYLINLIK